MRVKTIDEWKGLFNYAGNLSVPSGGLLTAQNVVFNKEGVIDIHRGFESIGLSDYAAEKMAKFNILGADRDLLLKMNYSTQAPTPQTVPLKRMKAGVTESFNVNMFSYNIESVSNAWYYLPQVKSYNGFAYISGDETRAGELSSSGVFQESKARVPQCLNPQANTTSLLNAAIGSFINPGKQIAYRFLYQIRKNIYNRFGQKVKEHVMNGKPSGRIVVDNPYVAISAISKSNNVLTLTVENASRFGLVIGSVVNLKNIKTYGVPESFTYNDTDKELTVELTGHGYTLGDNITFEGAGVDSLNGQFTIIDVPDADNFVISVDETATVFTADRVYKNQDIANGDFTVKTISSDTITLEISQSANGFSDYCDNELEAANEDEFMKLGAYVQVKIDIFKQFGSSSNEKYNLVGYKSLEADLEQGLIASDRLYQFYTGDVTATSSSTISIIDNIPEELLGAGLYTNDNLPDNGPNSEPPGCLDIESYKDYMFYANTKQLPSKKLQLVYLPPSYASATRAIVGTPGSVNAFVVTRNGTSYKYYPAVGEQLAGTATGNNRYFKSYQDIIMSTGLGSSMTYTAGVLTVTTRPSNTDPNGWHLLKVGDVFSIDGAVENAYNAIYRVTSAPNEYTLTAKVIDRELPSSATHVSGGYWTLRPFASVSTQLEKTTLSFTRVVNENAGDVYCQSTYDKNNPVSAPGEFILTARTFGADLGDLLSASWEGSVQNGFSPDISTLGSAENKAFSYERRANKLMFSKQYFPHAVPDTGSNEIEVGGSDTTILRIVAVADALYILTSDGIYRLTGDSPKDFNLQPYDLTTNLFAPETVAQVDGQIYFLSNKGVVKIGGNGVDIISNQIKGFIDPTLVTDSTPSTFNIIGWGYDLERRYYIRTLSGTFVYDIDGKRWSQFTLGTVGIECSALDFNLDDTDETKRLFLDGLYRERRSAANSLSDYKMPGGTLSISEFSGNQIKLTSGSMQVGSVFSDGSSHYGKVKSYNSSTGFYTLYANWGGSTGSISYYKPIEVVMEFAYFPGDTTENKIFKEFRIYPVNNNFSLVYYSWATDLTTDSEYGTYELLDFYDRNDTAAMINQVNASPVREVIAPMKRRGRVGKLKVSHYVAEEKLTVQELSYVYDTAGYKPSRTSEKT